MSTAEKKSEARTEAGTETETPSSPGGNPITGLIKTARPKQWVKNVLVLAAPFAALAREADRDNVLQGSVVLDVAIAFVAFCLAASAVYLINDAIDVEADRAHPTKRNRPIAAGIVPVPMAYGASVALFIAALGVSLIAGWPLLIVIAVYCAVQIGYCLGLKHQPVIDLCIVASGFLLRAIAGGAAAGIPLSQWFLLVTGFGALFMVAGKRYGEIILYERTGAKIRESLKKYSASYLRFVWATAAAIMIMSYCLWAFETRQGDTSNSVWVVVSIVPLVVAVLRYAVDVDQGNAGEPEEIALGDRVLQVLGLAWVATVAMSAFI
ncbi:decaprenyl-phosphate phosphoribosyltransferase [Herbihabitans rhizosphaerae]|uniref:Decaprenyl-phosphate phosphoribosyltransferase n=1 Tax=Herbihabitans rhizosphaerae TaxID=1872711 RepID=A0A4Q7L9L8_9PSEU|nr:decaprenyl-phosphate phosphoribosyltransferase [Herbihabitans rhizosphaerae]RZS45142.1 decaprenyl-phosphate phosphoribosyltransferase [Herbihabitans rhizosphaerae]